MRAIFHTLDGCVRVIEAVGIYPPPRTFLLPLMHPVVTMLAKDEALLSDAWNETRPYDLGSIIHGEVHYFERNMKVGT